MFLKNYQEKVTQLKIQIHNNQNAPILEPEELPFIIVNDH